MEFVSLSISFWRYTFEIVYFVLNNISSKSVSKTPYEIWLGRRPNLSYFRVWGYLAYIKRLQTDKLSSKSDKYNFVGYPKEMRGYYFYLPAEQKVFVSSKAYFLKKYTL